MLVLFHIMLIGAFVYATKDTAFTLLAVYAFLLCIWIIENKKTRKYRALVNGISAEHTFHSRNVSIYQSGYIRMRIDKLAAGSFTFKSNFLISVNVPPGKDAQGMKKTIDEINQITEDLHSEGLLVSSQMGINSTADDSNEDNVQCVYPLLIVINENITPERLGKLYNSLLKSIMDNGSNDCEQFTISGTDSGTIYKHYRGNLCIGMIECEKDKRIVFNSTIDRAAYFGNDEKEYSEQQYIDLRDSITGDGFHLTLEEAARYIKQILKKRDRGIQISMFHDTEMFSVSISKRKSSESFYLTKQDGLWWIFGYGNMLAVPVLSTESETEAARMMVRLVINVKSRIDS